MTSDTLGLVLPFILTSAAYGGSLAAGFMFDDPLDLPRATRSWIEILTSAGESSYYRPLVLAIWKVAFVALGRHDPVLLHALALATHGLNGWLVYQLGRRLVGRGAALLAMTFFVLYPLSYQAVGVVNAFFHLLVATWVLLASLLYWDLRVGGRRSRLRAGLVLLVTAAGILTHENGFVAVAVILLIEAALRLDRRASRLFLLPALALVEAMALLGLWAVVPRYRTPWVIDPRSLQQNGLFFLQGLAYPVSGQLDRLPLWGGSGTRGLVLAAVGTLAALTLLFAIRRRLLTLGFGLGWLIAGAIPAAVLLSWDYVKDGPRLLYLGSVGIALLWGAALAPDFRAGPVRLSVPALARVAIALVVLAWSWRFVEHRMDLQNQGAAVVTQLAETATRAGPEAGRVYVNLPSWLAPRRPGFLLGSTGVTMIPQYIGPGRSVYVHRGEQPPLASVAYPAVAQEWDAYYGVHGGPVGDDDLDRAFRQGGGIYSTRFAPGRLDLLYVGRLETKAEPVRTPTARFGDWAVLDRAEAWRAGDDLVVDLVWQALRAAPADFTVLVHVVGATPEPIAQADGYPIGGMLAPRRWRPGDSIQDRRYVAGVTWDATSPVRVLIGLYDRAAGARAPAADANGRPYQDNVMPINLREATRDSR